jgi:hypothetical protein
MSSWPALGANFELTRLKRHLKARQVTTHSHASPPFDGVRASAQIGHRDYCSLTAGGSWSFPELHGPGVVTCIWMTFARSVLDLFLPRSMPAHRYLWIHVFYDGATEPAISTPIGHWFGNGTARRVHFHSRFTGMTAGGYFSFLPMPFARSCRITLENRHPTQGIVCLFGAVSYYELPELDPELGYLHTQYQARTFSGSPRVAGDRVPNDPHLVLQVDSGPGHYIGLTLTIYPPSALRSRFRPPYIGFPYLEGNLKVFVDDEVQEPEAKLISKPLGAPQGAQSIEHTGVEDYALSAWYFQQAPFSALWHGCPVRSWLTGAVSLYRFHELDAYPWQRRIRMTLTHGEFDDVDCRMESLAYYYQVPWTNVARSGS